MRPLVITLLAVSTSAAYAEKPRLVFDKATITGKVAPKTVATTLESNNAKLLACYTQELAVGATVKGTVTTTFSIEADGKVVTASVPGVTSTLSKCLVSVLTKLTFAKPDDGLRAEVRVRLLFSNGTTQAGASASVSGKGAPVHSALIGGPPAAGGTFQPGLSTGTSAGGPTGLGMTGSSTGLGSMGTPGGSFGNSPGNGYRAVPVKSSTASLGTPTIRGSNRDAELVRRYVKRYIKQVGDCYDKELLVTPGIAGTLTVDFTIAADGKVTTATAKGVHANVEACVASAIQNIEFPKSQTPNDVTVRYPITFKPLTQPTTQPTTTTPLTQPTTQPTTTTPTKP